MVNDDVLFAFRLPRFSLASELGNVCQACRIFGIHPSTYNEERAHTGRLTRGKTPLEASIVARKMRPR